jgi:hypothetical protein
MDFALRFGLDALTRTRRGDPRPIEKCFTSSSKCPAKLPLMIGRLRGMAFILERRGGSQSHAR